MNTEDDNTPPAFGKPHLQSFRATHGLPELPPPIPHVDDALERHKTALQRADWHLPKVEPHERKQFDRLLTEAENAHGKRVDAHIQRLRRTGRALGQRLVRHEITKEDAVRRIDAIALQPDTESLTSMLLVPYREALAIVEAAFATGAREVAL